MAAGLGPRAAVECCFAGSHWILPGRRFGTLGHPEQSSYRTPRAAIDMGRGHAFLAGVSKYSKRNRPSRKEVRRDPIMIAVPFCQTRAAAQRSDQERRRSERFLEQTKRVCRSAGNKYARARIANRERGRIRLSLRRACGWT